MSPHAPAPQASGDAPARTIRPRRTIRHIVFPALVALGVGMVLLVSARSVLRGATPVSVRPVLFAATEAPATEQSNATEGTPQRRGTGQSVQAPGWLEADPFFIAAAALADGIVDEMLVLEGERVEKGQVVARLVADDAELSLQRAEAELRAAEAAVALAKANETAARTDWEHPVERTRAVGVAEGALGETEGELAQLPSLVAAEQAVLERLREEFDRLNEAARTGAANPIEVVILAKRVEAQASGVEALAARGAILEAKRERQKAELAAARENAELRIMERRALDASIANLARAEADLAEARVQLAEAELRMERMTIVAPISGFVQRRLKVPGDKAITMMDSPHSAHLLHLYDPEKIQVRVDVPLADAAHVFEGQSCRVVVDVLPDATFAGEVTRITHEADLQKNTLQVKVRVIDPSPLLRPEMLTRVKFLADGQAGANADPTPTTAPARPVLVSLDCIGSDGRAWVIRDRRGERGVASPVTITIDEERGGWALVRSTELTPGDLLATTDIELSEGERVRVRAAEVNGRDAS